MARALANIAAACGLTLVFGVLRAASGDEPGRAPKLPVQPMVLRYQRPAKDWNEALPIGNGRLGAMVFGGTGSERIQLNEDTIWAGERRDRGNPAAFENLAEVRRLLFAGKPAEAEDLAERTMIAIPKRLPPYQPLGDLLLRFPGHEEMLLYLEDFAKDFGLVELVRFEHEVVRVERVDEVSHEWVVESRTRRSESEKEEEEEKEEVFEAVVVCNGHHTEPRIAHFPGLF